ncbi:sugar O-acetyltransferase [Tautonia sociabilis]|uniref:Nodulation protein L n=1 Tax=Tautonia sociabilis TaxID=2080755 RepID=A0A432MC14_9BACT|nr:sugar O-acetyltransferase [Tautonia sociabilis]
MLAGEPYVATDPELVAARGRARVLLASYNATLPEEEQRRRELLQLLIGRLGDGVWIEPPFSCDYGEFLELGTDVYLNFHCVFLDCNRIRVGDRTKFGPAVQVYAASHPLCPAERREGRELALPVTIGADVWVGGGAIICPGVTIGDGTTIGAGSVVTRDVPPNVLAAGNPCRVIRSLPAGNG